MYEEMDSKGRTTRELAEEIMTGLGVSMETRDSWNVKRLNDAIAAIDHCRHLEYPCYIGARALEGFEARVKTTNALLKGDKSESARGIKREAKSALDFARRLHLGQDISEALVTT